MRSIHEVRTICDGLDHPECVAFGPDGRGYAGGEAGQVYRFTLDGRVETYAMTGGGINGVCLDAAATAYVCDYGSSAVHCVTSDGAVAEYSRGLPEQPAIEPNFAAFDSLGTLYYSDSGSYYQPNGRLFAVHPGARTELAFGGHLHYPNGLALDAEGRWLYVVLSTAPSIVRFPILEPGRLGEPETYVRLAGVVPDGIAFGVSGSLYVACYSPDVILRVGPTRVVEVVVEDPGSERLNRPTNVAFVPGSTELAFANFGGHTVRAIDVGEAGLPLRYPELP